MDLIENPSSFFGELEGKGFVKTLLYTPGAHTPMEVEVSVGTTEKTKSTDDITINGFTTTVITLPRSKIAVHVPEDFSVKDITSAQRYSKGDAVKVNLFMFARCCRFNGETWTMDQIREAVHGKDWLTLLTKFFDDGNEPNGSDTDEDSVDA